MQALKIAFATAALGSASPAFASMNAEVFYQKAVALKKKGALAAFSKDVKPMVAEMKANGKAVKAENEAAKKRGKPLFCPPQKSGMNSDELISELKALGPATRKSMNTRQAFRSILIKRYPCR